MSVVYTHIVSMRGPEEIAEIVGCRMVDGVCVVHQPREWEGRRPGCPYVDALMASAGYKALRKPTANQLSPRASASRTTSKRSGAESAGLDQHAVNVARAAP